MTKQLTDQMWKDALEKWRPGNNHSGACRFCNIYSSMDLNCPGTPCIENGCPLATPAGASSATVCCGGSWRKWSHDHTEENALAVHDFIASKYIEWLENNREVKAEKTLLEKLVDFAENQGWGTYPAEEIMFLAGDIDGHFVAVIGRNGIVDFVIVHKDISERIYNYGGVGWFRAFHMRVLSK